MERLSRVIAPFLPARTAKVQLEEVVAVVNGIRMSKRVGKEQDAGKKTVTLGGATETSQHTFNEDEKEQFVEHINAALGDDKVLAKRMPIESTTMQVFDEVKDGLVLCKLINDAVPGTIDERVLVGDPLRSRLVGSFLIQVANLHRIPAQSFPFTK